MTSPITRTLGEIWPDAPADQAALPVTGLCADSRLLQPGDVFIAQKGLQRDAREFIPEVLARGAVAALVERGGRWSDDRIIDGKPAMVVDQLAQQLGHIAARFFDHPSRDMTLLAVTGTNGKTSVAHLLAGSLTALGKKAAVLGTVGNGIYGQLKKSSHTTLDAIQLQRHLAEFRAEGVEYVALEASSHGLALGRLLGTYIHTALFTNLTRDHLDFHGTMTAYAAAKAKLFRWPELHSVVLNADDEQFGPLCVGLDPAVNCISYSQRGTSGATLRALAIAPSLQGLDIDLETPGGKKQLHSRLLGRFNVSNLLAVLGGLVSVGVAEAEALAALATVPAVPGRMECAGGEGRPTVVVDYAHTPDALEKTLLSLREHTRGRLVCLFGCGGDRDQGKRAQMAVVAEHLADEVIVTSDNPRAENPEDIAAEICAGFSSAAHFQVELDRRSAIAMAIATAAANDVVLVAGKGHEDYQEISGVRQPFSDIDEVRTGLARWRSA